MAEHRCERCQKTFTRRYRLTTLHKKKQCDEQLRRQQPNFRQLSRRLRNRRFRERANESDPESDPEPEIPAAAQEPVQEPEPDEELDPEPDVDYGVGVENPDIDSDSDVEIVDDPREQCVVCKHPIDKKDAVVTECNHRFHNTCQLRWFVYKFPAIRGFNPEDPVTVFDCPLCRTNLLRRAFLCHICGNAAKREHIVQKCRSCYKVAHFHCFRAHAADQEGAGHVPVCYTCGRP